MNRKKLKCLILAMALASSALTAGCGKDSIGTDNIKTNVDEEHSEYMLSFVAADKTNWDLEINLGDYAYTLAVNLDDDNTFVLEGTCVGKAKEEANSGMGGFGGAEPAKEEPEEVPVEEDTDKDYSVYDFDIAGTWSYEDGWGYTLSFEDNSGTVVTANYDKASSRHYFYYDLAPTVDGVQVEAKQVQFQVQDQEFRKTMADDYVIAEERTAQYIFTASGADATGNASKTTIYCMEGGKAAVEILRGSSTSYSTGTWTEDESIHNLTLNINDTEYMADYCDITGKEGYRLKYESSGGMGGFGGNSATICYAVIADDMNVADYTASDFEGETIHTLACPEGDYTIELTEKGYLNVYSDGSTVESATYTYDEAADVYTLILGGESCTTTKEGDIYSVTGSFTKQQGGFMPPEQQNSEPDTRTFSF